MKRFFYACLAAFALAGAVMSCQVAAHNLPQRDWKREMALTGNDLPTFLKYNPTDGAR
ncbi:hypothetical protein AEAC466_01995 [Asticcacaulis sp. AC466]|uniref:hypothetical protein n=1 Tax=Asticcacaulis sp. AC466 TaxID=1282362 RepID=UPI0003C3F7D0|nr:hypothetical protein [Asticcacaulis sp. AC466]ESQ85979.1 hypothetical protein AEAC466_01995 [Asticcacaulis sp. AC466]